MSNESKEKLQCYNRSCGQLFDPSENTAESCLHHPGGPVFHDVYKKWSCCEKKTTDFTEFLNFKGCTRSYHSNVKPPEPSKMEQKDGNEEVISHPPPQKKAMKRPDGSIPMVKLPFTVGASLQPMLDKMHKEATTQQEIENDNVIKMNTPCHNSGCSKVYRGEKSNEETCVYHSGVPIFHEGMKYWSCCVKRTTDFDSFLEQVGCTVGKHRWHKEKKKEKTSCRYDWHQTGKNVVISVYSKCPLPEMCSVEANAVKLHIYIVFGKEECVFDEEILLFGVVDIEACLVTYLGSKVEIKLKKAEPVSWSKLIHPENIMDIDGINLNEK